MLEWVNVPETEFVNPSGETTSVKLIYDMVESDGSYTIDVNGRDIDLIASDELGTEAEALNILQNNKVMISEYDFDMQKIPTLRIPL